MNKPNITKSKLEVYGYTKQEQTNTNLIREQRVRTASSLIVESGVGSSRPLFPVIIGHRDIHDGWCIHDNVHSYAVSEMFETYVEQITMLDVIFGLSKKLENTASPLTGSLDNYLDH